MKRAPILLLLAAFGLAAASAIVFFKARDGGPGGTRLAAPERPRISASSSSSASSVDTDLEAFLKQLTESSSDPAAREFAKEVKSDPDLNEGWEEMVAAAKAKDPAKPLDRFAEAAIESPKFQALLAKRSQDSAFRRIAAGLANSWPLRQALAAAHQRGVSVAAQRTARGLARPNESLVPPADPVAEARPVESAQGARPASGARAGSARQGLAAGAQDDGGEERTTMPKGFASREAGAPGPSAHDVGKMGALKSAGSASELNAWRSLCYRNDPAISKAECAALEKQLGSYAIWGACYTAGLYDRCSQLCNSKPELGCAPAASLYDACIDAEMAELSCADEACAAGDTSHCPPCPAGTQMGPDGSCSDPGIANPSACTARAAAVSDTHDCVWYPGTSQCFCFWKDRNSKFEFAASNASQCQKPNLECTFNAQLNRCFCLSPRGKDERAACQERGGTWLAAFSRCSDGQAKNDDCALRGGVILANGACSVRPPK